ncbi:MAG: hypothetical protein S0880_29440 [Actinomycetota bacterium]|nr:hypothetical protein [Actinomycetota bacterium]
MVTPFEGLRPAPPADVEWLVGARSSADREGGYRVGWTVPVGHDGVRRVLPPLDPPGAAGSQGAGPLTTGGAEPRRRWADVLPELTEPDVAPPADLMDRLPADASVGALIDPLVELLRPLTTTPDDCTFAVWDGWGWSRQARSITVVGASEETERELRARHDRAMAAVESFVASCPVAPGWGGRDQFVCRGPLDALRTIGGPGVVEDEVSSLMAQVWWPADHAWVVAHEIDDEWVYVAGGPEVMARIDADPLLESTPVGLDDRL